MGITEWRIKNALQCPFCPRKHPIGGPYCEAPFVRAILPKEAFMPKKWEVPEMFKALVALKSEDEIKGPGVYLQHWYGIKGTLCGSAPEEDGVHRVAMHESLVTCPACQKILGKSKFSCWWKSEEKP